MKKCFINLKLGQLIQVEQLSVTGKKDFYYNRFGNVLDSYIS